MSIELDQKDLTILERLSKKGRMTYSQLGEELNLSVPSIKSRIEKLLKIGVIDHIGIHLNPHTLTSDRAAIIALKVDPRKKNQLFDFLSAIESVREIYEVMDEYNVNLYTQHIGFSESERLFESLMERPEVQHGKIIFITKRVLSKPHTIPKSTTLLNVRCEYCRKQIEKTYETEKFEGVPHYFCCTSCLSNYKKWRTAQIKGK